MPTDERPTEARIPTSDRHQAATAAWSVLVMNKSGVFTHPLPSNGELTIGRGAEADLRVDDARVSRAHAILRVGAGCELVDLGSMNGTVLGDRRLASNETVALTVGDMISIGSTVLVLQPAVVDQPPVRVWSKESFDARVQDEHERAAKRGASFAVVEVRFDPEWLGIASTSTKSSVAPHVSRVEGMEATLRQTLRPRDVISSHGVGAYELLLPDTVADVAHAIASQLRERLRHAGGKLSVGVACYPRDGESPQSLEAKAHESVLPEANDEPPASIRADAGPMSRLAPTLDRIAKSSINALILGETGVGKEVAARAIHERSPRASEQLVCINCAALSESLLESELFGHERGAFTGALQAKAGLLEAANGGSVFLDEVGEMPLSLQAKLLRVLEQREVLRVGSLKPRPIDVRFIAATNRDLEKEIAAGRFREDLYFRLNGFSVTIPPLRERIEEIEPLARAFAIRASEVARRAPPRIAPPVLALLKRYRWPGNVRELRNMMERAVVLCDGPVIMLEHVPAEKMAPAIAPTPEARRTRVTEMPSGPARGAERDPWEIDTMSLSAAQLDAFGALGPNATEKERIIAALDACSGNQTHAAKLLGVSRRTLITRIEQYDLPRPRKK